MLAPEIPKVRIGVSVDLTVFWNDLGSDVNNVVRATSRPENLKGLARGIRSYE